jgi:hypothetical protein
MFHVEQFDSRSHGTFLAVSTYHTGMSVVPGWRVCGGSEA